MKKIFNILLLVIVILMPPLWVIIYMDYTTWTLYKREKYDVPKNFFTFLYQRHNLPYHSYKKKS